MKKFAIWGSSALLCVVLVFAFWMFPIASDENQKEGSDAVHEIMVDEYIEPPIPVAVSEVAWTWEAPEGSWVERVEPVPSGALIHLNSGAARIDPQTGKTAWVYLVPEEMADVSVSPNGMTAVVSAAGHLAVLDTATGELKHTLEHSDAGADSLVFSRAGVVTDMGMVSVAEGEGETFVDLTPWPEGEAGWRSGPLRCESGDKAYEVKQVLAVESQILLVYRCSDNDTVMAEVDMDSGSQNWSLSLEREFGYTPHHSFAVVGDKAVLQNISLERGTIVIDTSEGEVLAADLPDGIGNDLLRVLPEGYMAVRETETEEGEERLEYEIRDFSNAVQKSVVVRSEEVAGKITGFLPLQDMLLKLSFIDGSKETQISTFSWDGEGKGKNIDLPIETEVVGLTSLGKVEAAMGPGTFEAVPGAVILREYPSSGYITRIVGLR